MTAVIGIINKQGIAIAADSAVTVTGANNRKIYNTANKIFTLSKYHPVGIMVYSSSEFISMPWEVIIKMFRSFLGEKSFPTLQDYQSAFIDYLEEMSYFHDEDERKEAVRRSFTNIIQDLIKEALAALPRDESDEDRLKAYFAELLNRNVDRYAQAYQEQELLSAFEDYKFEDFQNNYRELIKEVATEHPNTPSIPIEVLPNLEYLLYVLICTPNFFGGSTGLVFAGFGSEEVYPSILSYKVGEVVADRLRIVQEVSDHVSAKNLAGIHPFAQTDVIDMFLTGIDPGVKQAYIGSVGNYLLGYNQVLAGLVEDEELRKKLLNLDVRPAVEQLNVQFQQLERSLRFLPTISTVANLGKEDLAEMAESLIYLTYLKRRTSSSEESVGGPIDVAIISKGDGFVWKKRKHYFEAELNQAFFANYLRH